MTESGAKGDENGVESSERGTERSRAHLAEQGEVWLVRQQRQHDQVGVQAVQAVPQLRDLHTKKPLSAHPREPWIAGSASGAETPPAITSRRGGARFTGGNLGVPLG